MSRSKNEFIADILVVDDDLNNLRLLMEILSKYGYDVRPVRDGNLALASVQAELPDLILLDIMMPGIDGYEVCSRLKADEKTRHIPIIFLSALYETFDKVKAFAVGGIDYITKPFQVEEAIARIENQLQVSRLQKQLKEQNDRLQQEIQERELMEEKLRFSQAKIRGFFEAMADIVLILDRDGKTIEVAPTNPGKLYPPGNDILDRTIQQFFGDRAKFFRDRIERALTKQQVVNCEYSLPLGQEQIWFSASIAPTSENTVAWVARDISDRKKAEEALMESAEREKAFSAVIQKMRQSLDIQTIFTTTTSELRQVVNCDRVVVYQFEPDWSGKFVAESVSSEWDSIVHQFSLPLPSNVTNNDNCAVKNLIDNNAFIRDTYLQETNGGIYNQGINYLAISDIYTAKFPDCYIEILERLQAKAYIVAPIFCGDRLWGLLAVYQNKSSRQWKEAEIAIVIHISNQLGIALQQAELLAQTQKQSEALQKALLAADAANRAKSEFLASMSHELRTPLNAILGFSQIMSRDSSIPSAHQKNLSIINRAGEHLLALIDDILEVSKIEAGRTTFNESNFNLIQLLDNLEKMLELKAATKGLELVFEYGAGIPEYVKTDEAKLRQVLINLLGNAIKFTKVGSVKLRVSVSCDLSEENQNYESEKMQLNFEIEDTGPGINPKEIHLLFEAFGQTETGRKSGQGTGLGLPISRKYVQLMGGDITVISTPGKGSLFSFKIKVNLPDLEDFSVKKIQAKVIRLAPNEPEYRILIVDDVLESRMLINELLTSIGFSIREAENGLEAVNIWESWQPDLILMDMQMPVMDGYEATKEIRAKEQEKIITSTVNRAEELQTCNSPLLFNKTVIFALTASAFEEQAKIFLSAGCDNFIRKPFQSEFLLEQISLYLGAQYEYEDESEVANETLKEQVEQPETILSENTWLNLLSEMPSEWISQIYDAACECSDDSVLESIAKIPPEKAELANALIDLVDNFQFGKIIQLTEKIAK